MKRSARTLAITAVASITILAACGGDDADTAATTVAPATSAAPDTTAGSSDTTAAPGTTLAADLALDTNGDGKVVFGVAIPGPRDDGAYYQALVDGVTAFSDANSFEAPVIVDNIPAADAATQIGNLVRQNVDVIMVGASEIADPLASLIPANDKILWYCNCGAGYQDESGLLIQSTDDSSEISYSAGYATGLLMKADGTTKAAMIGNNNFAFEQEAFQAFEMGLKAVDPAFEWTYVPTGSFNDVAAATEAFNNLLAQGLGAVYPFLGGAHEAVVKLANENDVIVMSAGSSTACERTDVSYDIAVQFDAGDYVTTILDELLAGQLKPGDVRAFKVGVDPQPGAVICGASAEQQAARDTVYEEIASGKFGEQFFAIKKAVYGF
jgi:basic membrane protein A and related proteins